MNAAPDHLLSLLRCPRCRAALRTGPDGRLACVRAGCGLRYPVRDGIPVMLIEEAQPPAAAPAPAGDPRP